MQQSRQQGNRIPPHALAGRDIFVFDLDNTLYPAECHLFTQIDQRMMSFIVEHLDVPAIEARRIQKDFYARYGATLHGLIREYHIKPRHFLDYVHDIDLSCLNPNPSLLTVLEALPGPAYIFTNGSTRHAENVTGKLGIGAAFAGIFDIEAADYLPKPHAATYHRFAERFGIMHHRAIMFEDLAINLKVPNALGQATILIRDSVNWPGDDPHCKKHPSAAESIPAYVDYQTEDLTGFLRSLITPQI